MLPLRSSGSATSVHQGGLRIGGDTGSGGNGGSGMDMLVEFMNGDGGGGGAFKNNVSTTTMPMGGPGNARVSKSHSEAERRRRQRINGHLATLRTLLPNTTKMDKASLLTEVVRQVRELRRYADDVAASWPDAWNGMVPGETDEVSMDRVVPAEDDGMVRISVCCEDRPGLMAEVNEAIRSVQARAVRAEMATVGGRTKSVVIVEGEVEGEERSVLHAALRAASQKPGPAGNRLVENKRLRFTRPLRMT